MPPSTAAARLFELRRGVAMAVSVSQEDGAREHIIPVVHKIGQNSAKPALKAILSA
jgi:hypothetical protein